MMNSNREDVSLLPVSSDYYDVGSLMNLQQNKVEYSQLNVSFNLSVISLQIFLLLLIYVSDTTNFAV